MSIVLSDRVNRVAPSPTMAVSAKANELRAAGHDIINLGVGEPDFDTPAHIKAAAMKALEAGDTKYSPVDGTKAVKQAIVDKFQRENQLSYALDEVMLSVGAKQVCYNACQALLNPGDEAIVPAPYWVSYPAMVQLAGAEPVVVHTTIAEHFKMTAEQLKKAITPKTKLLFLNSPSNPSGMVYTKAELKALADVLLANPQVLILTDDMYEHIYCHNQPFANIVNVEPKLRDRTLVVNGVSKAYAMTGWRVGYVGAHPDIIKAMKKVQSQSTSGACSLAQAATVEALNGDQTCIKDMLAAFKQRHALVFKGLSEIDGVTVLPSEGTFYSFPDFSQVIARLEGIENDLAFATYLLEKAGVALVPGSAFGAPGCMRLSFAASDEQLTDAMSRLQKVCA